MSIPLEEAPRRTADAETLVQVLKRDRAVVLAALVCLTAIAWVYLVRMDDSTVVVGAGFTKRMPMSCCGADFLLTFVMWVVMMVGMMLPSVAPTVLTFAAVNRRRAERGGPFVPASLFLLGYLIAWTAFSFLATAAQWALYRSELLDPFRQSVDPWLGGVLLLLAGLFQLTPAKRSCLSHCRSPLDFLTRDWRDGKLGALVMGLRHGGYCTVCCWMLMALLFVAGVMNLLWVAALSAFVLFEKLLPWGRAVARLGGVACLVSGTMFIAYDFWPA